MNLFSLWSTMSAGQSMLRFLSPTEKYILSRLLQLVLGVLCKRLRIGTKLEEPYQPYLLNICLPRLTIYYKVVYISH